ncbi:hypothetical protein VKT23_005440 [Stygiomarasmius scandens]|uniref:Mucin-like protein n=1 Tax=Marasmiellus scandens TaxID=2682957 RepID=A0ABR1JWH8_9AGAR
MWIPILVLFVCSRATSYPFSNIPNLSPRVFPPLLGPDFDDGYSLTTSPVSFLTSTSKSYSLDSTHLLHAFSSSTAGSSITETPKKNVPSFSSYTPFQSHSIIGSPKPLSTLSTIFHPSVILPTATYSYTPVSPTFAKESSSMSPGEASQWKVIGVGVLTIASITAIVLLIIFFDSWWGLLCDLFGRKKHEEGVEDMVPDWEKRSWEFKLASEDGHRYPVHGMMSQTQTYIQEKRNPAVSSREPSSFSYDPAFTNQWPTICTPLAQPPAYYAPDLDPHPLDPLFRRPSTRNPIANSPSLLPYH